MAPLTPTSYCDFIARVENTCTVAAFPNKCNNCRNNPKAGLQRHNSVDSLLYKTPFIYSREKGDQQREVDCERGSPGD
ncbi:hypothetical protein JOB18_013035 [Solea senegalensis]|uniref:Uncharacterized protein n=1 Tax=Solea senegalensis TaxID=28829 RepID=A0AAV6RJE6_SOLSE|nr:hypothetical protein JOB18_013035 [Solea senegalensis]